MLNVHEQEFKAPFKLKTTCKLKTDCCLTRFSQPCGQNYAKYFDFSESDYWLQHIHLKQDVTHKSVQLFRENDDDDDKCFCGVLLCSL